tara:strand:- start:37394 stop:38059 length:666 start_codon:yes stop_codon:yes gene_type:complete
MNMKTNYRVSGILALLFCAQVMADGYTPDVVEFDGTTTLAFDAAPQLVLADGGTVEFWVVPDWNSDPGYDPAILSNKGPEGLSYLVAMLRDRSGIAFAAGEAEDVFTFDFADGRLHHVAISQFDDGISIYVDGQVVGGSATKSLNLPSDGVWVGSIDGANNRFVGAIAGMRFWDTVLTQQEIVEFALTDVFDGDHPNIDNLSAMSNFSSGELLLVQPESEQ